MFFAGWKHWMQRWRAVPARRVPPRRAGAKRLETLEERLLLGQLVTPPLPLDLSPSVGQEFAFLKTIAPQAGQPVPFSASAVIESANVAEDPAVPQGSSPSPTPVENQSQSILAENLGSQLISELTTDVTPSFKNGTTNPQGVMRPIKSSETPTSQQPSEQTASESAGNPDSSSSAGAIGIAAGSVTGNSSPTTSSTNAGTSVSSLQSPASVSAPVSGLQSATYSSRSESLAAIGGDPQLSTTDVEQLLDRASAATPSNDAIIAVVDRQGIILGVRTESGVPTADLATLVFSIDGAVAKARTAAFFANDQAPLTSRTVRFISQTTITEREVNSNPSITDMTSTIAGPGFVAPIGLGGHFPPGVSNTPPVDLFAIEHTNRDSIDSYPGGAGRFNADYVSATQEINAPGSYGVQSGLMPTAQPRGIATLPGGIPLFRDTDGNGVGDTVVGGIGVFFPGPDGYASFEQGFVHGDGVSTNKRTNAPLVIESEFIALAAIGSSKKAGVKAGPIDGVAPVPDIDLPFGRLDLVGITLQVVGPTAGIEGLRQLLKFGKNLGGGTVNGTDQPVSGADALLAGTAVPTGWLVAPHAGGDLSAADVTRIINQGIAEAKKVRAAIRLPIGSRTRMVFAVTDLDGNVLGLFRMDDATYFSLDVAVAKARNMAYYNDPTAIQPEDRVLPKQDPAVNPKGVAFTARTFRFLAEPRYPAGQDGTKPGPFSILNEPSINPKNAENLGAPAPANTFDTVQGYDSFNIGTNFRDTGSPSDNQNGVVFFPGSSGVYKDGKLVGGLGVSGDGVDQDDVVTNAAIAGFAAPSAIRADRYTLRKVRLPYTKFLRNPHG